jgi:hypothetical protein
MARMFRGGGFTPEALVDAIKMLSRSLDNANLDCLEQTHAMLEQHFYSVTSDRNATNFSEQRLVGVLWAEIEVAINAKRKKE